MASDKKNGRGSKKGESITVAERKARKVAERLAREIFLHDGVFLRDGLKMRECFL